MRSGRQSTGFICNLVTLVLAMYALLTSSWVWSRTISWNWSTTLATTLGTGPYVVSYSSASVSKFYTYSWSSYSLWYSDVNDSACNSSNAVLVGSNSALTAYEAFGQYGFCSEADGVFQVPGPVKVIRGFTILTIIFSFLCTLLSCAVSSKGKRFSIILAALSFLATVFALVTFSQAAAFDYYKALRNGEAGMLIPVDGSTTDFALVNYDTGMWLGPSFYAILLAFFFELYATYAYFSASRAPNTDPVSADRDIEVELGADTYNATTGSKVQV